MVKAARAAFFVLLLALSGCARTIDDMNIRAYQTTPAAPPEAAEATAAPRGEGWLCTVMAGEYLSLRARPDAKAECLRRLSPGTLVRVIWQRGAFSRAVVADTGETGYLLSAYLLKGNRTAPGLEDASGIFFDGLYRACARSGLPLRVAPDEDAECVGLLPDGARVRALEAAGAFARVEEIKTGARGYASADYLILSDGEPGQCAPERAGPRAVICREYLTLRASPDSASEAVARLLPGARVEALSFEGEYVRVRTDTGLTGYLPVAYTARIDAPTAAVQNPPDTGGGEGGTYRAVCDDFLTVRAAPSVFAQSAGRLAPGERVAVDFFDGMFAHVTQPGGKISGFALSGYLEFAGEDAHPPDIVRATGAYSYERMTADLYRMQKEYPGRLRVETAGASAQGRRIPAALLGDPNGKYHVLIQAGIHGREHMSSLLAMAQIEACLKYPDAPYADGTAGDWLEGVCLHILPMTNPDGVAVSQADRMPDPVLKIYMRDVVLGLTDLSGRAYLQTWKANAAGVDINRNFDAGWDALFTRDEPSFAYWKGEAPGDQPETAALAAYLQKYDFDAAVSYHAYGSCVYQAYGDDRRVNRLSRDLARAVYACARYPLEPSDALDAGGFTDWANIQLGVPSVTIEIGARPCPLPAGEFSSIWQRNRGIPAAIARWVKNTFSR